MRLTQTFRQRCYCGPALAAVWFPLMAILVWHCALWHTDEPHIVGWLEMFALSLLTGLLVAATVLVRSGGRRAHAERLLAVQRDLSLALAASCNLDEALNHVFVAVFRIEGVDGAGMFWVDADRRETRLAAHRGLSEAFVQHVAHYGSDAPQTELVLQGRSVFGSVGIDFPFDDLRIDGYRALAVLPIRHDDRIIAALNVASRTRVRFPKETCRVLEDVASRLGTILRWIRTDGELQEAQQRAMHAERLAAIGETVAGFTHESGNALQRAQACLEMLALEVQDRPAAVDLVRRLQAAQDDLQHLYSQLRQYAGPIVLQRIAVSPREIALAAWDDLEHVRRHRDAALDTDDLTEGASCLADPSALRRVFRNLFANALDAACDPVRVAMFGRGILRDGRVRVEIRVRDNGPGLTDEQRARLFEPFYTTKPHGMGLGMSISKRIVEALGGHIAAAESSEYDGGTEIVLEFPRD